MEWLLEGDAAFRWQVLRDLVGAGSDAVERERAKIAREGWGAIAGETRLARRVGCWQVRRRRIMFAEVDVHDVHDAVVAGFGDACG